MLKRFLELSPKDQVVIYCTIGEYCVAVRSKKILIVLHVFVSSLGYNARLAVLQC